MQKLLLLAGNVDYTGSVLTVQLSVDTDVSECSTDSFFSSSSHSWHSEKNERRAHSPAQFGKFWKIQGRNGVAAPKIWLLRAESNLLQLLHRLFVEEEVIKQDTLFRARGHLEDLGSIPGEGHSQLKPKPRLAKPSPSHTKAPGAVPIPYSIQHKYSFKCQ